LRSLSMISINTAKIMKNINIPINLPYTKIFDKNFAIKGIYGIINIAKKNRYGQNVRQILRGSEYVIVSTSVKI